MSVFHSVPGVPCAKMERFAGSLKVKLVHFRLSTPDYQLKTEHRFKIDTILII